MIRLNITLPDDLAEELRQKKNKSRYIAAALKEKLLKEKREAMEQLLVEGYSDTADDDLIDEWDVAGIEQWD